MDHRASLSMRGGLAVEEWLIFRAIVSMKPRDFPKRRGWTTSRRLIPAKSPENWFASAPRSPAGPARF